jgi:malate dehydrogenase (oxaloacetate-decarboxylating)
LTQSGEGRPGQEGKKKAGDPAAYAVAAHRLCAGKVQVLPKCSMDRYEHLAVWYTPGVAAASRAIVADPQEVYALTNRANAVAIVSDGSRVLGLGDIGPEAGLPVMEGKALLFKYFGGVDAVPLCVDMHDVDGIVSLVKALAPSFGAVNLEDISAPKCFRVLDRLREELSIPVWHDDQQGTATVVLAGLLNALEIVGKPLKEARIALVGIGAANMAVYRLLKAEGADPARIIACDRGGALHRGRNDIEAKRDRFPEKWQVCSETNPDRVAGGIAEALAGSDVCIAFSTPGPDVIAPEAVSAMADDAIVFACANPVPEIDPAEARAAGARIVATGRSDFPNQVNNSLAFPGILRGVLDVRARKITDGMARAAAMAMAGAAKARGHSETAILPRTDDIEVAADIAAATGMAAQEEGVAGLSIARDRLRDMALERIQAARAATSALTERGLVPSAADIDVAGD